MSGTNFIHGIVIVGAIIVLGEADDTFLKVIGFVAMVLASANVVGGWFVTDRMLEMFKKRPEPKKEQRRAVIAVISQSSTRSGCSTWSRSSASSSRCASSPRRSTHGAGTGSAGSG